MFSSKFPLDDLEKTYTWADNDVLQHFFVVHMTRYLAF